eukprot:gene42502-52712_t
MPTWKPTKLPTKRPTALSTLHPTQDPTRLSNLRPSPSPTRFVHVVPILMGGEYGLSDFETHYIINVTANAVVSIKNQRTSNIALNISVLYTVIPQSHVYIHIEYFSNRSDLIDLTAFETVRSLSDLNITRGSAIIHLGSNQTIKIQNLFPEHLSESNFLFFSGVLSESTDSADETDETDNALVALIVAVFGLAILIPLAAPSWRYLRNRQGNLAAKKQNKTHFLFNEEDNISDSSIAVSDLSDESDETKSSESSASHQTRQAGTLIAASEHGLSTRFPSRAVSV